MKTFGILVKNVIYHMITKETYIDIFNLIMKAFGIQVMNVTNVLSIGVKNNNMKLHCKPYSMGWKNKDMNFINSLLPMLSIISSMISTILSVNITYIIDLCSG